MGPYGVRCSARGLIGFRTQFLTETRGAGISSSYSIEHEPWAGEIEYRTNGSLIADRAGVVTPYAMINLQERGTFFGAHPPRCTRA